MKFIIAVVVLVLAAVNTSAHVLPLAYHLPLAYSYAPSISLTQGHAVYSAPALLPAYSTTSHLATHLALTQPVSVESGSESGFTVDAPVAVHSGYSGVAVAVPVAVPSASYVATTRGSQHVAPLPGHVQSVSSQNLEPAAGTL